MAASSTTQPVKRPRGRPPASAATPSLLLAPMAPPHMLKGPSDSVPVLRLVWDIVSFVKAKSQCSAEQIEANTGINVFVRPDLLAQLQQNPRISIFNNLFSYQPIHVITNEEEFFQKVSQHPLGILASDIANDYNDTPNAVQSLSSQGKIFVVESGDRKWLFANRQDLHGIKLDPSFKEEWKKICDKAKPPSEDQVNQFFKNTEITEPKAPGDVKRPRLS